MPPANQPEIALGPLSLPFLGHPFSIQVVKREEDENKRVQDEDVLREKKGGNSVSGSLDLNPRPSSGNAALFLVISESEILLVSQRREPPRRAHPSRYHCSTAPPPISHVEHIF